MKIIAHSMILTLFCLWGYKEWAYRKALRLLKEKIIQQGKKVFDLNYDIIDRNILNQEELKNLNQTFPFREMKLFISKAKETELDLTFSPMFEYEDHTPIESLRFVPLFLIKEAFKYFIVGPDHLSKSHSVIDHYLEELTMIFSSKIQFETSPSQKKIQYVELYSNRNKGIKPLWITTKFQEIFDYIFLKWLRWKHQLIFIDNPKAFSLPLLYRHVSDKNSNMVIFPGSGYALNTIYKLMRRISSSTNIYIMMVPILRCHLSCKHNFKMDMGTFVEESLKILINIFKIKSIDHIISWSFGGCCSNLLVKYVKNNYQEYLSIKKITMLESFCSVFSYSSAYAICLKAPIESYRLLSHLTRTETRKQKIINLYIIYYLHHFRIRWFCYLFVYYRHILFDFGMLNHPEISILLRTNDFLSPFDKNLEFKYILDYLTKNSLHIEYGEHGSNLKDSFAKIPF